MFNLLKSDDEKFIQYVENFREKTIPERYNQINLVDELMNDEIDHYMSISNRSDGKSFNYIHFFINFAIDYDVYFTLISRQFTVRASYRELITKILTVSPILKEKDFEFINTQYYMGIIYKDKMIGIITDLNSATNLKYLSNFIQDFPIIVYDEFLALEGDYLPDEWERLKTIYSSIDRNEKIETIGFPKLFYLGNAVNFSSPILNNLNIFNTLENHPLNTVKQYKNVYLEMVKNENANEERNLRAFSESDDKMTQGQFEINTFGLASEKDRTEVLNKQRTIIVKLDFNFLKIDYNFDTYKTILSITGYEKTYDYNINLKDNNDHSIFLKDSYFSNNHSKKYINESYLFDNNFTKDFITNNPRFNQLKINRLISEKQLEFENMTLFDRNQINYENRYKEQTKRNLARKFFDHE